MKPKDKIILANRNRIMDSCSRKNLLSLSHKVNDVWNFIGELLMQEHQDVLAGKIPEKPLTHYSVDAITKHKFKGSGLHSQTIQAISKFYFVALKTAKDKAEKKKKPLPIRLDWRDAKRSLGWIPFKASAIKFIMTNSGHHAVKYMKTDFKLWLSRPLPEGAEIKTGSFNVDAKGRWYVSITFEMNKTEFVHPKGKVGIDPGIKDAMTLSDGIHIPSPKQTNKYAEALASAQRAGKKKRVRSIHAAIKNSRKDYLHKITSILAKNYSSIYFGDASSQQLIDKSEWKTRTKGIYDAAWFMIKSFLSYKVKKLGGDFKEVSERWTTRDCSACGAPTGPTGSKQISVREWDCCICHAVHDRDVNAARNILRIGHYTP
jgi:putative transposase